MGIFSLIASAFTSDAQAVPKVALTAAQLNAHIRSMLVDRLTFETAEDRSPDNQALLFLLRACADHARLGDADSIEAAKTSAQFLFETVIGRSATANDLHFLRNHLAQTVNGSGLF